MFERYSPAAQRVMRLAQGEANRLGHNMTGPEHVAIALLADEREPAAATLRSFRVDQERLRASAAALHPPEPEGSSVAIPPFSAATQRLMEAARRSALQSGRQRVETGDLLVAVLDEEGGQAVLAHAGVEAEQARSAIDRIRSSIPAVSSVVAPGASAPPSEETPAPAGDDGSPSTAASSLGDQP